MRAHTHIPQTLALMHTGLDAAVIALAAMAEDPCHESNKTGVQLAGSVLEAIRRHVPALACSRQFCLLQHSPSYSPPPFQTDFILALVLFLPPVGHCQPHFLLLHHM
jgi:hypothetical protein